MEENIVTLWFGLSTVEEKSWLWQLKFPLLIVIDAKKLLNEYLLSTSLPLLQNPTGPERPHQDTTATSDLDVSPWVKIRFGEWAFIGFRDFPFFLTCQIWKLHENCLCIFLQEGCGESCSQGSPGVPGMAGAKGEKGDDGKPGVTPLDSCDRVRVDVSCWLSISRIIAVVTNGTVDSLVVVLWQMQNGNPSFCIVFKFAWHDVRSYQSDMMPAVITYSRLLPVFGETSERAGDTSSGQSRSFLDSKDMHTFTQTHVHISWCFMYLPYRVTDPAREHPEFQDHLDHQE